MKRRELFVGTTGNTCVQGARTCGTADLIPNVSLRTHDDVPVRFYGDLVKGRQVVINMMYATCEGLCPAVTSRLVEVHRALAPRMGRDLFMYSITLKPNEDGPAALREFADMHASSTIRSIVGGTSRRSRARRRSFSTYRGRIRRNRSSSGCGTTAPCRTRLDAKWRSTAIAR